MEPRAIAPRRRREPAPSESRGKVKRSAKLKRDAAAAREDQGCEAKAARRRPETGAQRRSVEAARTRRQSKASPGSPGFDQSSPGATMGPKEVVIMDQEERVARFGVLCTGPTRRDANGVVIEQDGILWAGGDWVPGGEYAQKLTVKNVTTKMKKLKYKLPQTRYFSLAFPETIELSPGMSQEIDVIFRPIKEEIYEDTIYFKLEELPVGTVISDAPIRGFHVPVRALLPTLQARIPDDVDMGLCPTAETSERTFYIENNGEVPCPYRWSVPEPFTLGPSYGLLEVGEAHEITCSLHPTQASVFVARASCEVGKGVNAIKPQPILEMKLSAVGKYVHIEVSDTRVDFGDVLAGSPITEELTREIVVSNRSVVHARVEVIRVERDREPVFAVHPTSLIVPPQSELPVMIQFHSRSAGTYTAEHLEFVTPGGNRPRLLLTGSSVAPVVKIYKQEDPFAKGFGVSTSVNFGSIKVGARCDRAVFLQNNSDADLHFQFVTDEGGCFKLSKYRGVIPAQLEVSVKFTFSPDRPINYYKRLFVIIEHRLPLFVDLLGTAYISAAGEVKEQRPAPLRHAHVQAARNRQAAGLGRASPDELENMHSELQEQGATADERLLFARIGAKGHDDVLLTTNTQDPVTRSGEATRSSVQVAHDLFEEYTDSDLKEVQVSQSHVDFGLKTVGSSGRRTITVTNTTRAKISVAWTPPPLIEVEGEKPAADFSVSPDYADVAAGQSLDFTVRFHPRKPNVYSLVDLEATVFFKSQRSFRLVNDAVLAPPWRLEVAASGHSFGGEQFAPALQSEPRERHWPGIHVGDAGYQSLKLKNSSNLPCLFSIEQDPVKAFAVRPSQGLIPPGGFQLLVARFEPKEERVYRHRVRLIVNGEPCDGPFLWGAGQIPRAMMVGCDEVTNPETGAGSVTFQPTCVGLASRRTFSVHNASRVPLVFDAVLPNRATQTFSLKPKTGVLRGNESQNVTVTFAPGARGLKKTKCVVAVRPLAGPPPQQRRDARQLGNAEPAKILQKVVCRLTAPASSGVISFDPPVLEYPTMLVNTSSQKALIIINSSDCAIKYSLDYVSRKRAFAVGEEPEATIRQLRKVPSEGKSERILIDEPEGLIAARQRKRVKVTFHPDAAGEFEFACACKVHAVDEDGNEIALDPEQASLLTLGEEARDVELVRGRDPFSATVAELSKKSPSLPLTCVVKGSASFPTIIVRDIRVEGAKLGCSTSAMWQHFSLSALNKTLLTPLTSKEVKFNQESSPDLQLLPRYPCKFVPEPLGNPPQVVLIQIENPGLLPASFSVHLPNERDIELEPWADEGEPSPEVVMVNKIIDELKCFDISPRQASLEPGGSCTLRIAYVPSSREFDGKHTLPILLKIGQGKQMWLDLEGRTLAPREPYLVVPKDPMTDKLPLHPVAVGTRPEHAPLQILECVNCGNSPLEYEVEYASLRGDEGIDLLRVENSTGHVPPFGSADLRVRFLPLQASSYEAPLSIKYKYTTKGGMREVQLDTILTCSGYDPRDETQDPHKGAKVPEGSTSINYDYQIVEAPSQPAVLSRECVDFGRNMQRAHVYRMVTIRAPKALDATTEKPPIYEYQWEAAHELVEKGILDVYPLSGKIFPGGVAVCRVALKADCEPQILDTQLMVLVKEAVRIEKRPRSRPSSPIMEERTSTATMHTKDPSHQSIILKCTTARERSLTQSTLPGNRLPMMPTSGTAVAPPPLGAPVPEPPNSASSNTSGRPPSAPPRSASTAAMMSTFGDKAPEQASILGGGSIVGCAASCFLRLRIRGEVVGEQQHMDLHNGDVDNLYIPRPLAYIPAASTVEEDPFESSDSSSDEEEEELTAEELADQREKVKREVLRRTMGDIVRSTLDLPEVRSVFRMLPEKPNVPYYVEIRPHDTILERMADDLQPYVRDGSISLGDARQAFLDIGLKATIVESKDFMKMLKENATDLTKVEDFFNGLSDQVSHAVVRALDDRDYNEKVRIRDERREARMKRVAPAEWKAASMLANAYRGKRAREWAAYRKWSLSHEGALMIKYAIILQQKYRCYQARKLLKRKAAERLHRVSHRLLGDANFQKMVFGAVEGTLLNLVQEALHHEFDLTAPPIQRCMPAEGSEE